MASYSTAYLIAFIDTRTNKTIEYGIYSEDTPTISADWAHLNQILVEKAVGDDFHDARQRLLRILSETIDVDESELQLVFRGVAAAWLNNKASYNTERYIKQDFIPIIRKWMPGISKVEYTHGNRCDQFVVVFHFNYDNQFEISVPKINQIE